MSKTGKMASLLHSKTVWGYAEKAMCLGLGLNSNHMFCLLDTACILPNV